MTGALVNAVAILGATKAKTTSGGGTELIVFVILIALAGYFLMIRPQRQKARRQQAQASTMGVGDEIVTIGGIVGKIVAIDSSHVTIVSGEDTSGFAAMGSEPMRLVLVRNAIARKIEPVVDAGDEPSSTEDHDHDHYGHEFDEHETDHDDEPPGDGRAAGAGGNGS